MLLASIISESVTIRKCGFVGVGMTLLEEVCHYGGGLSGFLCSGYCPVSQSTFACLQDVGLKATTPAPCVFARHHASHHDDNGLSL